MKKLIALTVAGLALWGACFVASSALVGCVAPTGGTPTTQPATVNTFDAEFAVEFAQALVEDGVIPIPPNYVALIADVQQAIANVDGMNKSATPEERKALIHALADATARLVKATAKAKA